MAITNYNYKKYEESDAVKRAKTNLDQAAASKPGAYQSQWQTQLNDTMGKIMNREKFSYDLNGDALYRQYKDNAVLQGQQAMMDTMGQAAAMTGGYGNSYAQMAGQQAYQQSLQQLNDVVPELYQLALDKYNREGQELYDQYGLLSDQDSRDYSRHRDTVSDWNTQMDRAQSAYDSERSFDYSKFSDDRSFDYGVYESNRDFEHQQEREAVADSQWQAEFDEDTRRYDQNFNYQQSRDAESDRQWQATFDEDKRRDERDYNYQVGRDAKADEQWQQSFNYEKERDTAADQQWAAEMAQVTAEDTSRYGYARTDEYGDTVFYNNGKEYTYDAGVNPYTSTKNPDVENGTFDNGYQPDNIGNVPVTETKYMATISGAQYPIYQCGGNYYIWSDTSNGYQQIDSKAVTDQVAFKGIKTGKTNRNVQDLMR